MKKTLLSSLICISSLAQAQIPTNGLVSQFPFNGNTNDVVGTNNGTMKRCPSGSSGHTFVADRFNVASAAIKINTGDYLDLTTAITSNTTSISMWFYKTTNDFVTLFSAIGTTGDSPFYVNQTGNVGLYNASGDVTTTNSPKVALNTWTLLTMTKQDKIAKLYINGDLALTHTDAISMSDRPVKEFFVNTCNVTQTPVGFFDDILIYNRILSQSEILTITGVDYTLSANWVKQATPPAGAYKLELSNTGDVYVIGATTANGNIYLKTKTGTSFSILPGNGTVTDIAVQGGKTYGIGLKNGLNNIYTYNSGVWALNTPAGEVYDLDFDGTTLIGSNSKAASTSNVYTLTPPANTWVALTGYLTDITRSPDGTTIGTDANGATYAYKNNAWSLISTTPMKSLTSSSIDNVWALNVNGNVFKYNKTSNAWDAKYAGDRFINISVYENQELWGIGLDNNIYKIDISGVTTSVEEDEIKVNNTIYPNPAKDILHVSGSAEIFDLVGNKVASGTNEINIEHLLSGIYVVKANGRSLKIVKE